MDTFEVVDISQEDDAAAATVCDADGALLAAVPQVSDKEQLLQVLRTAQDAAVKELGAGGAKLLQLLGWSSNGDRLIRPTSPSDLQLALAVSALEYAVFSDDQQHQYAERVKQEKKADDEEVVEVSKPEAAGKAAGKRPVAPREHTPRKRREEVIDLEEQPSPPTTAMSAPIDLTEEPSLPTTGVSSPIDVSTTSDATSMVPVRFRVGNEQHVRLRVDFGANLELYLLFTDLKVQALLRESFRDLYPEDDDVVQLAETFVLCTEPGGDVYDRERASSTTLAEMIGSAGGASGGGPSLVLRVRPTERAHRRQSITEMSGLGKCEAVKIVRLRYRPPSGNYIGQQHLAHVLQQQQGQLVDGASPIMLIKNFNLDGGVGLSTKLWEKSSAAGATNYRGRATHYLHHQMTLSIAHDPLERAADRVLDLCEHVCLLRGDNAAYRALHARKPYRMHAARPYPAGQPNSLPRHVDGIDGWVVLFSFGCSVEFDVGGKTVLIETGDALVFNGGAAHAVVHGISRPVHGTASHRGKEKRGLVGFHPSGPAFDDWRVSVQARQQ